MPPEAQTAELKTLRPERSEMRVAIPRVARIFGFCLMSIFVATACGSTAGSGTQKVTSTSAGGGQQIIRITTQYGLSFAPLDVVVAKNLLAKYAPNAKLEVNRTGSGAALNQALAAEKVDVGLTGIAPVLVAWDKGLTYRIMSGINESPLALETSDPAIHSLKDFKPGDKIAMPSPNSTQALLLDLAAQKELGNAKALASDYVSMPHPEAMAALINHQIAAHYASPPFVFEEAAKPGMHQLTNSESVIGRFSFTVAVATKSFHDSHPDLYRALVSALTDGIAYVTANPDQTAAILAAENPKGPSASQYANWLRQPGVHYETAPQGLEAFGKAMKQFGQLQKAPSSWHDLCWDNLANASGS